MPRYLKTSSLELPIIFFQPLPDELDYWRTSRIATAVSAPWQSLTAADVMIHNKASASWSSTTGKNVTIGIIDTGIESSMPEFHATKQSPFSQSYVYSSPWNDTQGHGSMCACAAGASSKLGGKYDGVASDSKLMSLRPNLTGSNIYILYDWVIQNKREGNFPGPVVLSNS